MLTGYHTRDQYRNRLCHLYWLPEQAMKNSPMTSSLMLTGLTRGLWWGTPAEHADSRSELQRDSRRRAGDSSSRQVSEFVAPGESIQVVGRAERQRLDGHRRLPSPAGDEARAVAQEQVGNIVSTVVAVDHRA